MCWRAYVDPRSSALGTTLHRPNRQLETSRSYDRVFKRNANRLPVVGGSVSPGAPFFLFLSKNTKIRRGKSHSFELDEEEADWCVVDACARGISGGVKERERERERENARERERVRAFLASGGGRFSHIHKNELFLCMEERERDRLFSFSLA